MSSTRANRLLASTPARLSAIYACLLAATILIGALAAWGATRIAATQDVRVRILAEAAVLHAALDDGGLSEAVARVRERSSYPTTFLYRLDSADGVTIAGEPDLPNAAMGWRFVDLSAAGRGDHYLLTESLPDGARLTIADDMERPERLRDAVLTTLAWVGAAAMLFGLAAGYWATRRTFVRMHALSQTVRAVSGGDLGVRAPARSAAAGDDLDELTASFNIMLDRVNTLVTSVRRVSMNVAHDLRTPLTRVQRRLDTAARAETPQERQDAIDAARAEIGALLRTSDAMLRLAEIESGAMRADFIDLDLTQVIEGVVDAYRPDIESLGHTLTLDLRAMPLVEGQPHLLSQALANLLENAMRHARAPAHIGVGLRATGDQVALSVHDDGPGLPASEHERLLRPFERMDESRTTPGSGLGLSIVQAIARLHGATLRLEDAAPGLRVTMLFPAQRSA